jgi:hypothetical protein
MRLALVIILLATIAAPARADEAADKAAAQTLVTEGVAALKKKDYDTAVAKFNAAYAKFPSPKILLNLGTTYKDMGRLADAANTYQKYLADPTVGMSDRLTEVRKILDDLDKSLVLLTINVSPAGSSVSIDDGPPEVIGSSLVTRVAPGIHVVKATLDGHDEAKDSVDSEKGTRRTVRLTLTKTKVETPVTGGGPPDGGNPDVAIGGPEDPDPPVFDPPVDDDDGPAPLPGLAVQARIDGKLRGSAMAIAVEYRPIAMLEAELAALLSNSYGVYVGGRFRFLQTKVSAHVGAGIPVFFSDGARYGARVALGGELQLGSRMSLLAEIGYEHFFNPEERIEANVLVPIVGVQGRIR